MQPPNMISTKDLSYLEDMMNWNLIAMKKAHFFATQVQDTDVQQMLDKVGNMYQQHYMQILSQLQ